MHGTVRRGTSAHTCVTNGGNGVSRLLQTIERALWYAVPADSGHGTQPTRRRLSTASTATTTRRREERDILDNTSTSKLTNIYSRKG